MNWNNQNSMFPVVDCQCLVKKGRDDYMILTWNSHEECWDDAEGDDYYASKEEFDSWLPMPLVEIAISNYKEL